MNRRTQSNDQVNAKYSFMPYNYIAHKRLRTAVLNNTTAYIHVITFYTLQKLLKPQNLYLDWHFVNIYFSPVSSYQTFHPSIHPLL